MRSVNPSSGRSPAGNTYLFPFVPPSWLRIKLSMRLNKRRLFRFHTLHYFSLPLLSLCSCGVRGSAEEIGVGWIVLPECSHVSTNRVPQRMVHTRILPEVCHLQRFCEPPNLLAACLRQLEFFGCRLFRSFSGLNELLIWPLHACRLLAPEDFSSHELMTR